MSKQAELAQLADAVTVDGGNATVSVNRKNTDGDIAVFRKDGTAVGSIVVDPSNIAIGSGDTGIYFNSGDDALIPVGTSGNLLSSRDNAIDLGRTNTRFKDAYIGGGVYLGGTGSANKLEDYEEGSWTPFIRINNGVQGITVSHANGAYTKVGRVVHVTARWRITDKGTNVGGVTLDGLPFNVANCLLYTSDAADE